MRLFGIRKLWLKLAFFGVLTSLLMIIGMSASVYRLFSAERIQAVADSAFAHGGRSVRFEGDIGRRWFPRPTVSLKNLKVVPLNGIRPDIEIQEASIGLAWESLWRSVPVVDKLRLDGLTLTLERRDDDTWNLQDLWQQGGSQRFELNRLQVENAALNLRLAHNEYTLDGVNLKVSDEESEGRMFTLSGRLRQSDLPLAFQGQGTLSAEGGVWRVPLFRLTAEGKFDQDSVTLAADSSLSWRPSENLLRADKVNLRLDSSYHNFHITAQIPKLLLNHQKIHLDRLTGAFTAAQWNGSLQLNQINLRRNLATLNGFELNAGHQGEKWQTGLKAAGSLLWEHQAGLSVKDIAFNLIQDSLDKSAVPRLNGNLKGMLNRSAAGAWQGSFDGQFDRQPVRLVLQYLPQSGQHPKLEAGISLKKLVLQPYWQDFQAQSGQIYPDFLSHPLMPAVEAQLNINQLQMPGVVLDKVDTLVSADSRHIALSNFTAELYGGKTEGGISMANTEPVSYHLQQDARGVEIRSLLEDLFGFHNFSGTGDAVIDITAKGSDHKSLIQSLDGTLTLNVSDGAWVGIDMNNILQSGKISKQTDKILQTPFKKFTLNSLIVKGVSHHLNAELLSDSLKVRSSGQTDLYRKEMAEEMLIYNVQKPLSKPIPLKITGPVDNLSVTLDYARLTDGLNTPQEKQKALEETFREQWQWLVPKKK
ncbi:AsmA family protein [Neisseria sp. ZJ106]|uniref:AsmA family protein n=1 Tax=Neisseria lisongii TaxID=2912188 RepID=A0ABY7RL18_9NEIS|nr:AsmA family protein [Neisseria lisongii]MCF7521396.1 AsmA family protein [Neisseria lisongii]WCL71921.1 AsmA family protein [Neisseria lisongii]